ncbi:MAG: class I SAM-dependent methyltransferase [bacterium]
MNEIQTDFDSFKQLIEEIKTTKDLTEYKSNFFNLIDTIAEKINSSTNQEYLKEEFFNICSGMECSLMHNRTRKKPCGYAGDYLLLDWIYTKKTADNGVGKLFDKLFHSYEAAISVRNRKEYFKNKCCELLQESSKRIDILDLACGSCRDVYEIYQSLTNSHKIHFHCVDSDPRAVGYAKKLLNGKINRYNIDINVADAFRLKTNKKYDLIWSAGLFDYLERRVAVLLLKKIWRHLKADGRIIFGNFSPKNPTRKGMELVGKWYLIHRSAAELIEICRETKLPVSEIEVESEPGGINLFCILKK